MDHHQDIESTLNALLLNTPQQPDLQKELLDTLFSQWGQLSEDEKRDFIKAGIETKMLQLAKHNQASLRSY